MGLVTTEESMSKEKEKERKQVRYSDTAKMQKGITICQDLKWMADGIKLESTNEFPASIYNTCKSAVNYIEGCARDLKVKPSDLKAIKLVKGKRVAVLHSKRVKRVRKAHNKEKVA